MNPEGRPAVRAPGVPDVEQRVDAGGVQRLAPCRPDEMSCPVVSGNLPPPALPLVRFAVETESAIDAPATHRERCEAEKRHQFDHGIDPLVRIIGQGSETRTVESQTVVLYADCRSRQRLTQSVGTRWPCEFVHLRQPMMQPFGRPPDPRDRMARERPPRSSRCSSPSSSTREPRQKDRRGLLSRARRTVRPEPSVSIHPRHSSFPRSAVPEGSSRSARIRPKPPPGRKRRKAPPRANPPRSSEVEYGDPTRSHRWPPARH